MIATQAAPGFWRSIGRPTLFVAVILLGILVLRRIPKTIEVFIVATLIAYGINPIVHRLEKRMPRLAVIVIVYALFLLLMLAGAIIVVPTILDQLQSLFANSGDYLNSAQAFLERQQAWLNRRFGGHMLPPQLTNLEGQAMDRLSGLLQSGLSSAGLLLVAVINGVVIGITAVVLSYYFLVNAHAIKQTFLSLFPDRAQRGAQLFVSEVGRVFGGYVGGQIILSAFCGVFTFLGLELLQTPYALLLGVLTGLLYAIPYLGVFAAMVVGMLLGLLQSWQVAVWIGAIIFAVTKVADTLLVPRVMSESVGISPMAIIFSVFAGGELFGLWGLILAIPAAALFKCVWMVWLLPWLTGKPASSDAA